MSTRLTKDELRDLLAVSLRAGGEIRLKGKVLPWQPFEVGDYLRYVVARHKSARAFFVMTMEGATLDAQVRAIEETRPLTAEEREGIQARREQLNEDYLIANAIDQTQSDAATLALGLGFPGDPDVEGWLVMTDPEEFEVALRTVEEGSWGDDPERFFSASWAGGCTAARCGRSWRRAKRRARNLGLRRPNRCRLPKRRLPHPSRTGRAAARPAGKPPRHPRRHDNGAGAVGLRPGGLAAVPGSGPGPRREARAHARGPRGVGIRRQRHVAGERPGNRQGLAGRQAVGSEP